MGTGGGPHLVGAPAHRTCAMRRARHRHPVVEGHGRHRPKEAETRDGVVIRGNGHPRRLRDDAIRGSGIEDMNAGDRAFVVNMQNMQMWV